MTKEESQIKWDERNKKLEQGATAKVDREQQIQFKAMSEYNSQIQLIKKKELDKSRQQKQASYDDFAARKEIFSSTFKSGRKDRIHDIQEQHLA